MMIIPLGILTLALAFGVAWINTRLAGLIWVGANFLGYQWLVEATRTVPADVAFAAHLTLALFIVYFSIMSLSGIGAAYLAKRSKRRAGA